MRLPAAPSDATLCDAPLDALFDAVLTQRAAAERAAGVAEGEGRTLARAAKALDSATESLERAREEAAAALARDAVQLAVEIARILVRSEIAAGCHNLEAMVRDALAASGVGRASCVVHLNPLDAAALASVKFRAGTAIESDDSVARGDVHVSTPHGLLVREIPETLRAIHDRLLGEVS